MEHIIFIGKNMLNKILCFIGIHTKDWAYTNELSCKQDFICKRCGKIKNRTQHIFLDWKCKNIKKQPCLEKRTCTRCNATEERIEHIWGEFEYYKQDSCYQVRVCKRCKEEEYGDEEHHWNEWRYESPTSCTLVRFCLRCHDSDYGEDEHIWDKNGKCKRCGEKDILS